MKEKESVFKRKNKKGMFSFKNIFTIKVTPRFQALLFNFKTALGNYICPIRTICMLKRQLYKYIYILLSHNTIGSIIRYMAEKKGNLLVISCYTDIVCQTRVFVLTIKKLKKRKKEKH